MKLRRLRIHRLKSIRSFDHRFEEAGLTLFGRSGSGKTTLLESISLLGHLGIMALAPLRRIEGGTRAFCDVSGSALNQALAGEPCEALVGGNADLRKVFQSFGSYLRGEAGPQPPRVEAGEARRLEIDVREDESVVDAAFRELTSLEANRPTLGFEVTPGGDEAPISLLVQLADAETDLSVALSHDISDCDSARDLTLYFDADCPRTRTLILQSLAARPWCLAPAGEAKPLAPWQPDGRTPPIVSYVNTDLNDFGRGNDLRESPKNITDDFAKVIRRLGIDTGKILEPLNGILSRILSDEGADAWSISELSVQDERTRLVVTDHFGEPQLRNHLSAGENEVFFAFLVLLGLPTSGGIVVLDEPAFHAGPETAPRFFDELYALADREEIQIFVGSHSAWSLPEESRYPTAVLEIPEQRGSPHRLLGTLDSRQRFQALHRRAFHRIERSVKGVENATRDSARLAAHSVREELGPLGEHLLRSRLGLYVGLAILIAGSLQIGTAAAGGWALAAFAVAAAGFAVLCLGFWNQVGRIDRERQQLVDVVTSERWDLAGGAPAQARLFRQELERASDWQLRAKLRELGIPFLDFVPTGGLWRALSFTLGHFAIAATIVWWYTGSWALGGQIALIEPIINGFWHYGNDRLWRARSAKS